MTPRQRFFLTIAVMASTIMQVLDTTIVNVALPQMQGQLGAAPDQISWVLTSYLVASAVMMPLTGFFSDLFGRRRHLLISIAGFVVTSMLCGMARNLEQIVIFRLLQGVFGAALVPLAQAVMVDSHTPEERPRAMSIWGMGVMVGPIIGPSLGGWLTEVLSWRWTFYINLPVGLLSLALCRHVPDTVPRQRAMDWPGFVFLGLAIAGLQYFLDRGNSADWFNDTGICISAAVSLFGLLAFLFHLSRGTSHPLFSTGIFRDRNFVTSSIVITALGFGMYGAMVIQPTMLEGLMGYPTAAAGLVMAPRGVASMISMQLVGRVMNYFDARLIILFGMGLSALGNYECTHFSLDVNAWQIIFPSILQGLGLGFMMVPLSTMAMATLEKHLVSDASGLYSLLRTLGSSMGIAAISTLYSRASQANWQSLGGAINPFNSALQNYVAQSLLHLQMPALPEILYRQASMVAVVQAFWWITASFVFMLPLLLLLKPLQKIVTTPVR